jgi:hypothetical protein
MSCIHTFQSQEHEIVALDFISHYLKFRFFKYTGSEFSRLFQVITE